VSRIVLGRFSELKRAVKLGKGRLKLNSFLTESRQAGRPGLRAFLSGETDISPEIDTVHEGGM